MKEGKNMRALLFSNPIADAFRELEAMMDFDFNKESNGLRKIIHRPHNLITKRDENGNPISYGIEIVYTPFKKNEVKVEVLDNCLTVKCGENNKERNEDMTYCGISHQSFEFSLPIPDTVDLSLIEAKADDGILSITMPVKAIEIKKAEPLQIAVQ